MTYNPYFTSGGYTTPEDDYNALHGGNSPGTILNSFAQKRALAAGTGSPFDALLSHATDFPAIAPGQSGAMVRVDNPDTGNGTTGGGNGTVGGGNGTVNTGASAGGTKPFSHPNPLTGPVNGNGTTGDITSVAGTGIGGNTTATGLTQQINPSTGKAYGVAPPTGVDPALWNDVDRYAQIAASKGANYSALYQHPEWVSDFRNWMIAHGNPAVRIEDWLEGNHPELSGLRGQAGLGDTYAKYMQDHPNPNAGPNGSNPNQPPTGTAQDIVNQWQQTHGVPSPGTMPTFPTTPPAQIQSPNDYLGALSKALNMSQQAQEAQALREYRSAAGQTGLQNTGAYLPGQGDIITNLNAQFGQQKAQLLNAATEAERARAFQGNQSALDRQLQQYGMDLSSYTSRFNTTTEAGIQQAAQAIQYDLGLRGIQVNKDQLAEQIRSNNLNYNLGVGQQDLQRYGIDQNNQTQLFQLMQSIGPEAVFALLFGKQLPPGYVPYTP